MNIPPSEGACEAGVEAACVVLPKTFAVLDAPVPAAGAWLNSPLVDDAGACDVALCAGWPACCWKSEGLLVVVLDATPSGAEDWPLAVVVGKVNGEADDVLLWVALLSSPNRGRLLPALVLVAGAALALVLAKLKAGAVLVAVPEDAGAGWLVCVPNKVAGGFPAGVVEKESGDGRVGCGVVAVPPVLKPANPVLDVVEAEVAGVPEEKMPLPCCWDVAAVVDAPPKGEPVPPVFDPKMPVLLLGAVEVVWFVVDPKRPVEVPLVVDVLLLFRLPNNDPLVVPDAAVVGVFCCWLPNKPPPEVPVVLPKRPAPLDACVAAGAEFAGGIEADWLLLPKLNGESRPVPLPNTLEVVLAFPADPNSPPLVPEAVFAFPAVPNSPPVVFVVLKRLPPCVLPLVFVGCPNPN